MDNIRRKIVKGLIADGLQFRKQVLEGVYLDGELAYVYEHWLKGVVDNLSTIRSDYAQEICRRGGVMTREGTDDTKVQIFGRAVGRVLDNLEALLNGRDILETKFSLKLPKGILKDDLELIYDGFRLYDAKLPEDKIDMREGVLKDIMIACFPESGIANRKLLERGLDRCKGRPFSKRFNTLQHNWASALHCTREFMQTVIYREGGYIFISEKVKSKWSL